MPCLALHGPSAGLHNDAILFLKSLAALQDKARVIKDDACKDCIPLQRYPKPRSGSSSSREIKKKEKKRKQKDPSLDPCRDMAMVALQLQHSPVHPSLPSET
jgi:hypothetical protein